MRPAYLFPAIAAAGLAAVASIASELALPILWVVAAYAVGVAFTVVASIVVNTCNAARYGRYIWDDQGAMDGVACHAEHMRRDRVRRHAEASANFPEGDVA